MSFFTLVIVISFDDAIFSFCLSDIQRRNIKPKLFKHIILDFSICCFGFSCGNIKFIKVQINVDMCIGFALGQLNNYFNVQRERKHIHRLDFCNLVAVFNGKTQVAGKRFRVAGDVAQAQPELLKRLLGINGIALWTYANGTDRSRVMHKDFVSPVKSIGHGITCNADLDNNDEVWKVILELSQDIGHRLRVHELSARTVQVFVRGNDLFGSQFQCKLPFKTQLPNEIAAVAFRAFKEHYTWNTKVRSITVRAIELAPKNQAEQLTLFDDAVYRKKRETLEDAVESIRGRFGKKAITYGILLGDLKMPCDGRDSVKMPGVMYQ